MAAPFRDARFLRLVLFGCWFSFFNGVTQLTENIYPWQVLGIGLFTSPNNSAIMGAVPQNYQGLASGIVATARSDLDTAAFRKLAKDACQSASGDSWSESEWVKFEKLVQYITIDATDPRFLERGESAAQELLRSAGAVAVGARQQIVNFNLNLDTHDMVAGKDIAKRLRASGGGLPAVRGKEIDLAARKQVQISTVLTDYKKSSMAKVLGTAMSLADEHKARIKSTEIVGLLPRQALVDFAIETLQLENFNPDVQILESRLEAVGALGGATDWMAAGRLVAEALSNTDATPGGGSAAAVSGAMGCGLGEMAIGITLKSKKLDEAKRPALTSAHKALGELRATFDRLAADDAAAFDRFMEAMSLPKDDASRPARMQAALVHAAEVPLRTAQMAAGALAVAKQAAPLAGAVAASGRVRIVDVAELNPRFDIDGRTARTAARLVAHIAERTVAT